jgi:glucosamine-phosphate N-acetyltransferase
MKGPGNCSSEVDIRELTALDLNQGFLEALASLAEVSLTPAQAGEVFRARLRAGIHTYVARLQRRVIGTASLILEQKFIHGGGLVGHLEDVAVNKDCQVHGVGTALVRHVMEEARKHGCYKVILNCQERLVPFYTRLGFRPHDRGMRCDF